MSTHVGARNEDEEFFAELTSGNDKGESPQAAPVIGPILSALVASGLPGQSSPPATEAVVLKASGFPAAVESEESSKASTNPPLAITDEQRKRKAFLEAAFWADAQALYLRSIEKGGLCRKVKSHGDTLTFEIGTENKKHGEVILDSRTNDLYVKGGGSR